MSEPPPNKPQSPVPAPKTPAELADDLRVSSGEIPPAIRENDFSFCAADVNSKTISLFDLPLGDITHQPPVGPAPATEDFGRYRNVRVLSEAGGMGAVYLATDPFLEREVVIKIIRPELVSRRADANRVIERFLSEAQIGAQLEHPNIMPVHEFGRFADGRVYFTMKYIRGDTLRDHIKFVRKQEQSRSNFRAATLSGRITAKSDSISTGDPNAPDIPRGRVPSSNRLRRDLLEKFIRLCEAVAFAHSKGVVHRDIKPENVMLGEFGELLLADWGLAKITTLPPPEAPTDKRNFTLFRTSDDAHSAVTLDDTADASAPSPTSDQSGMATTEPLSPHDLPTLDLSPSVAASATGSGPTIDMPAPAEPMAGDNEDFSKTLPSRRPTATRKSGRQPAANVVATASASAIGDTEAVDAGPRVHLDFERFRAEFGLNVRHESSRTMAGSVVGTLGFMAPEQARGDALDTRADIFSLGCILYEMATLSPPFPQRARIELMMANMRGDVIPAEKRVANPQALGDLAPILAKALAANPEERYQRVTDLMRDVDAFREFRSTEHTTLWQRVTNLIRRNRTILTTAAVMLAVTLAAIYSVLSRHALVDIESSPDGAAIFIDGEYVGDTNFTEHKLRPGTYEVRLEKAGFYGETVRVDVSPGFHGVITRQFLRAQTGHIRAVSVPSKATVELFDADGRLVDRGVTPWFSEPLPEGEYRLRCALDGYRDDKGEHIVRVQDGSQTTPVDIALVSTQGYATVSTTIPRAGVEIIGIDGTIVATGEIANEPWRSPKLPAGRYRLTVNAPDARDPDGPRWIEIPGNDATESVLVELRSNFGFLSVNSSVPNTKFVLLAEDGRARESVSPFADVLPSGKYTIRLLSGDYRILDATGDARSVHVIVPDDNEPVNVFLNMQRIVGEFELQSDTRTFGANLTLLNAARAAMAGGQVAVVANGTLPVEPMSLAPGTYIATVAHMGRYPLRFPVTIDPDRPTKMFVTMEPVVKARMRGLSVGQLATARERRLIPVCGDVDGDLAPEIAVLEDDALLVYSPVRRELVWPPITLANDLGDVPMAAFGDIDGDGDADLVVAFADQFHGYEAPTGDLAFVRDGRGRVDVRGLWLVSPPARTAAEMAGLPRLGKTIVVATARALIGYRGFHTDGSWAIATPDVPDGMRRWLTELPTLTRDVRYAYSAANFGTMVVDADGKLVRRWPDAVIVGENRGQTYFARGGKIFVARANYLLGAESLDSIGREIAVGEVLDARTIGEAMVVAVRAPTGGFALVWADDAGVKRIELPAEPTDMTVVQQRGFDALVVVALRSGERLILDADLREIVEAASAPMSDSAGFWRGIAGTGQAVDIDCDGNDELIWLTKDHVEILDLDRARLQFSLDAAVERVWLAGRETDGAWLLYCPGELLAVGMDGRFRGRWAIEGRDAPALATVKIDGRDSESWAVMMAGEKRVPLVPATEIREISPLAVGATMPIGSPTASGPRVALTADRLLQITTRDVAVGQWLAWPGKFTRAWIVPNRGIVAVDRAGVTRLFAGFTPASRDGAHLLAFCMKQIAGDESADVSPHIPELLARLPNAADALWVAGVAEARQKKWAGAENFWQRAIDANPTIVRARFDLASRLAETKRWDRVHELLEPVFLARYRFAHTVWLLLNEAIQSESLDRARYYWQVFESADPGIDPEFATLRNPKMNPKYTDVRLWVRIYLQ